MRFQRRGALGSVSGNTPTDNFTQVKYHRHGDAVDCPVSFLATSNDTDGGQYSKLLGYVGLLHAGLVHQFSDTRGALLKDLENAEPTGFRKHREKVRHRMKLRFAKRFVDRSG